MGFIVVQVASKISEIPAMARASQPQGRRIMVVDDSRVQRRILESQLVRSGHHVIQAETAEQALRLAESEPPDLVISDWMMGGMSGIELCQAIRRLVSDRYVYFILLTSKAEKEEIVLGLEKGADDFLIKPITGDELRARILAGDRILRMERELTEKNRLVSRAFDELRRMHDMINRDLAEARKLQQSLLRETHRDFGAGEVTLMLRPAGHVGGDLVGFFTIDSDRVGLFSIDVSGHGITSALMTARLAGFFHGVASDGNVAMTRMPDGTIQPRPPAEVAARLNAILLEEIRTDIYFTMVYAIVDLSRGRVRLVQAGHPHPMIQRPDGSVRPIGAGGLPIGLIPDGAWQDVTLQMQPDDRLLIVSDGITEAENRSHVQLGDDGLAALMQDTRGLKGQAMLDALMRGVVRHAGAEPADDVSAILFDYRGPSPS